MTTVPPPADFADNARWLTQAIDPSATIVRLVDMNEERYRAAAFLDDRLFQQAPPPTMLCDWNDLARSIETTSRPGPGWIFHIGHVGSTLVARLLGELAGFLSIREPRLLRDLVALKPEAIARTAPVARGFFARPLGARTSVLVKATSFVSELAPRLFDEGGRALFLYASPVNYVCSILAGENSRRELAMLADTRAARMAARITGLDDARRSEAHLAAAAWACEMTSLEASAAQIGQQAILWADFDRMLDDVAGSLERITSFFGLPGGVQVLTEIASGPLMGRYSKALDYEYSPALRRDLLDEAGRDYRTQIDAAMAMLHKAAGTSPLLASALVRAGTES